MRFAFVIILFAEIACCGHAGAADTLARIKAGGEIRLGYFTGSAPFSFAAADKSPQGICARGCPTGQPLVHSWLALLYCVQRT